jgi:hypothetical protein
MGGNCNRVPGRHPVRYFLLTRGKGKGAGWLRVDADGVVLVPCRDAASDAVAARFVFGLATSTRSDI